MAAPLAGHEAIKHAGEVLLILHNICTTFLGSGDSAFLLAFSARVLLFLHNIREYTDTEWTQPLSDPALTI